jgi:hypothetical protein
MRAIRLARYGHTSARGVPVTVIQRSAWGRSGPCRMGRCPKASNRKRCALSTQAVARSRPSAPTLDAPGRDQRGRASMGAKATGQFGVRSRIRRGKAIGRLLGCARSDPVLGAPGQMELPAAGSGPHGLVIDFGQVADHHKTVISPHVRALNGLRFKAGDCDRTPPISSCRGRMPPTGLGGTLVPPVTGNTRR